MQEERQSKNRSDIENTILSTIPEDIDYMKIQHISTETKEKLAKIRPVTLGQASRIGGVKPADIAVLSVLIESKAYRN